MADTPVQPDAAGAPDDALLARLRASVGLSDAADLRRRLQASLEREYAVGELLGRGAAGAVFRARDVRLGRTVAVKCAVSGAGPADVAAMFDEARLLARISHPHVVAVYALHEEADPPCFVMEHVDGPPLDEALADAPLAQRLGVFRQVLAGVAELHRRGLVHRDLKPDNVRVDAGGTAKVLDMGIARPLDAAGLPQTPTPLAGTPAYLAPEVAGGAPPTPAADVFALGVMLFELLTGQRPFTGATTADVLRAVRDDPPPLPRELRADLPGALQAVCLAAIEKDPADRYATARDMLLDLDRYLAGEAVTANPRMLQDILDHGVARHVEDLERWRRDRLVTTRECDYLVDKYERLRQREDFWVLDARRISFSQVVLHLGAWGCVVAALLAQRYQVVGPWARTALPLAIVLVLGGLGAVLWRRGNRRVSLVLLMAAAMAWPLLGVTLLDAAGGRIGASARDLWPVLTNVEWTYVTATWAAACLGLWRATRTSAFSLIWAISAVALATALFSVAGMKDWSDDERAAAYLGAGAALFALAVALDLGWRRAYLAVPQYVIGLALVVGAASVLAIRGPTTEWLGAARLAREMGVEALNAGRQINYSLMINGAAYLIMGLVADRSRTSRSLRRIAVLLFWLAPSHLLAPLARLAHEGAWPVLPGGWTVPETLLIAGALAFVFASVPKQIRSFFFSGLGYVAAGIWLITVRHFQTAFAWPVLLAAAGLALALVAWRRPSLFDRQRRAAGR
jgi:hypothetical protein